MLNQNNKKALIAGALVVIVAVALVIYFIARKPKTPENQVPLVTETTATTPAKSKPVTRKPSEVVSDPKSESSVGTAKGTATFESSQLGFSFSYPASWGMISQKNSSSGSSSFEYRLTFAHKPDVAVVGKSYSFQRAGTKIHSYDLTTDTAAESVCQKKPSEKVATESGVAGLYVRGESLSETGGCTGDNTEVQYAVFDINRTAKNVVFVATDAIEKDDLISVVRTLKF